MLLRSYWGKLPPSAALTIYLCNGINQYALVVSTDPLHQFRHRQKARRLSHSAFPMHPLGLNRIEPGTLARQPTEQQATAALTFGLPVVGLDLRPHRLADVPGGVVPDEHEGPFALGGTREGQPG